MSAHPGRDVAAAIEECLTRTSEALLELGLASREELTRCENAVRQSHEDGHPGDLIEAIAHLQGNPPDQVTSVMNQLSEKIARSLSPTPPMIPFAARLITPTAFYEAFPEIRKLCKALLSPVVYAEDTDAIGTASLNPIAAMIVAEEIQIAAQFQTGIRPFVSIALIDFDGWAAVTRKHFER
ncbi:hypothetical protein JIN85_09235 [Luteolibacter pohnpeiensis]|uniref:Uncharacterized protein n=1 Tax=Luteolibacter pohnpeiensis TaxID=454153 RepID=A0A934S668_9BACT|nr:hypothetical protein [Luteolibacter pohnpeiensis]MBK1882598.1 hypothetical protein [Luteolibacter pohnpeiensis]